MANIKISTRDINDLKRYTREKTGQKAVKKALIYFLRDAHQRRILKTLKSISFKKGFDPLAHRQNER